VSFAHETVVTGAVADVPCQAPGLPWSTIAVRVCPPFDARLRERERAMRARIGSKSARNSPYPGPRPVNSSTRSRQDKQVRNAPFLIFAFSRSIHARASSSGLCPPGPRSCIMRPSHLRVSHARPGLSGRPRGWWKISAVSIQRACESLRAFRSDSSE
jgi:hypothetical protein